MYLRFFQHLKKILEVYIEFLNKYNMHFEMISNVTSSDGLNDRSIEDFQLKKIKSNSRLVSITGDE